MKSKLTIHRIKSKRSVKLLIFEMKPLNRLGEEWLDRGMPGWEGRITIRSVSTLFAEGFIDST